MQMDQAANRAIAIGFTLFAAASLAVASDAEGKSKAAIASNLSAAPVAVAAVTRDLQPFSHTTYIPAGADLASIRFESVKAIKVVTARTSFADRRYCQSALQEPGGSAYCPYVRDVSSVPAYRVTYSFSGPPMAGDEYGGSQFTFSVNMRPEDLSPAARQAISERKMSRASAARFFALTTSKGSAQRVVIDEAASAFCAGGYTDTGWTHTNTGCREKVTYKTIAVPSDYIAVKVDPAAVQ